MKLVKIDKNGSKHFEGQIECDRCNGRGIYYWGAMINGTPQHAGTCYKCNGAGTVFGTKIERTPEYEAKLAAQRQARAEAKAKERAEEQAKREAEIAEKRAAEAAERAERERKELERKAKSQYVGADGERIKGLKVRFTGNAMFESSYGWETKTIYIHHFRDENENLLIWKTESHLGKYDDGRWIPVEEGDMIELTGTVKEHNVYRNEKQTVLTRCKIAF